MGSKRNDPMQREILTYLQYNYTEPLRLETLAEQFHLSENICPAILNSTFI